MLISSFFLGDAASGHQRFSHRALRDYLESEGHVPTSIALAMQEWEAFWLCDQESGGDEFVVAETGWATWAAHRVSIS